MIVTFCLTCFQTIVFHTGFLREGGSVSEHPGLKRGGGGRGFFSLHTAHVAHKTEVSSECGTLNTKTPSSIFKKRISKDKNTYTTPPYAYCIRYMVENNENHIS